MSKSYRLLLQYCEVSRKVMRWLISMILRGEVINLTLSESGAVDQSFNA